MSVECCEIEIRIGDEWRLLGELTFLGGKSVQTPSYFEYDVDYVSEAGFGLRDFRAASLNFPLSFEKYECEAWPPFLFDLLPQGAYRRQLSAKLQLSGPNADLPLLQLGAGNPPGNIRIKGAEDALDEIPVGHIGFTKDDIIERNEDFIDYAYLAGAPVSGSSGAQGEAPKFLLRCSYDGRWHADGVLADEDTKACYIVKFPRGKSEQDRLILRIEAAYWQVAKWFGIEVAEPITWEKDCLFIPRFDRKRIAGQLDYFGLESLCSGAGVAAFGASISQINLLKVIREFSSEPERDAAEYFRRDVLNVALGNVDNHARNSAFLKSTSGSVRLSPLFDFAPMYLDSACIARLCRWPNEPAMTPPWGKLAVELEDQGLIGNRLALIEELIERVGGLREAMTDFGVPKAVIEDRRNRIESVHRALELQS